MIEIPENIDSKYRFVILAALRARQIQAGSPPLIEDTSGKKPTEIAQEELMGNLVQFTIPESDDPSED